jgi:hypothetical protein
MVHKKITQANKIQKTTKKKKEKHGRYIYLI